MFLTALGERRKQGGGITYPSMNSSYFSLHLLLKTTVICKDLHFCFLEEKKETKQNNPAITGSCSKKVIKLIRETAMKGD